MADAPTLVLPNGFKAGRLAPVKDRRTLKLKNFINRKALEAPDPQVVLSARAKPPWGMYMNDQLGCCTIASACHALQVWSAWASQEIQLSDADCLKAYKAVSGYNGNPRTDVGAVVLNVMNYWRKVGVGGRKIAAFVQLNPKDKDMLDRATKWFGGVYFGINLTQNAMDQLERNEPWTAPRSWWESRRPQWRSIGGHAIYVPDYNRAQRVRRCVTWGQNQIMTDDFVSFYCEEAWAMLSPDWFTSAKKTPTGLDVKSLYEKLQEVQTN